MENCPCGSGMNYSECCEPFIKSEKNPDTAEQLMRSRYSAYVKQETDYLHQTVLPEKRSPEDDKTAREWAKQAEWFGLNIVNTEEGLAGDTTGTVEFIVKYSQKGEKINHHEVAKFTKSDDGKWYFEDGIGVKPSQFKREGRKIGRNEPCPCGSGKKYKKCCG